MGEENKSCIYNYPYPNLLPPERELILAYFKLAALQVGHGFSPPLSGLCP